MNLDDILETRLSRRSDGESSDWCVWEHKTLNIHRGVLQRRVQDKAYEYAQFMEEVRQHVQACFRYQWWRGFAFGVVIEVSVIPADLPLIEQSIDTRALIKPVWQWNILACQESQLAVGVHTWTEGYLSPLFRQIMERYQDNGYTVGSFKKEKDRLMKFLTSAAALKGMSFEEFSQ